VNIRIRGELTTADSKKHIPHYFDVPEGTTQVEINFDYAPIKSAGQRYANQISMTVFDPTGSRGARHNNRDQYVRINAFEATPGYTPGPVPAGMWTIFIDTHRIVPPDAITYELQITLSTDVIAVPENASPREAITPRGEGWYRGDLHSHTLHSDGSWDVPELVQYARDRGYDFITLTDHNTVSGLPHIDRLSDAQMLTMGGMELTTYYGHALALGIRQWVEWRVDTDQHLTMTDLARHVIASGAFFVIAHPRSPGDPECTGCRWEYRDMMPGIAQGVEIWNGPWCDYNEDGVSLFYQWLNEGHHLVATAGSDIHGATHEGQEGAFNVVYASELTERAVMDGVRRGHLYMSAGPALTLDARSSSGKTAIMGDTLPDEPAALQVTWNEGVERGVLRLITDGVPHSEMPVPSTGEATWTLGHGQAAWCTVEYRDSKNQLLAITNPIFFGSNHA
jgi:hypothetical protein